MSSASELSQNGADLGLGPFEPPVDDGPDPELAALPAPPRALRRLTLVLMAAVVGAAIALGYSVRADVGYFFADGSATSLGSATALDRDALVPNSYVHVEGSPMLSTSVRYRRMVGSDYYTLSPLAGQRDVYVQVAYEDADAERLATRREFTGRLVTFRQLGARFAHVRRYLESRMDQPVSADSYVLLADEPPASYFWSLLLIAMVVMIGLFDLWLLLRWFRPLPTDASDS